MSDVKLTHSESIELRAIQILWPEHPCQNSHVFYWAIKAGLVEKYQVSESNEHYRLTDAGRQALAAYDAEWRLVPASLLTRLIEAADMVEMTGEYGEELFAAEKRQAREILEAKC